MFAAADADAPQSFGALTTRDAPIAESIINNLNRLTHAWRPDMNISWRTICLRCGLHLKKHYWIQTDENMSGQGRCRCPRCDTLHEKYNTLDEDGFGRAIQILETLD